MGIAAIDAAISRVDAGELTEAEALAEIKNNETLSAIIPDVETFKLDTGLTIDELSLMRQRQRLQSQLISRASLIWIFLRSFLQHRTLRCLQAM